MGRAIEVLMIDDDVITARLRSIFDDDNRQAKDIYRPNPSEACDVTSFRLTTLADVVILGCVLWKLCLRTIHSFLYLNTCRSFNFLLFIEQKKIQNHSCKTQLVHTIQKLYS